jgi:hypothetical protein
MTRYKSVERPPVARSVQIEVDGQRHEGTYRVDGSVVAVESLLLGNRRGPLGDGPPEIVAKLLLLELVQLNDRRTA